jgi:hypothetical protein
LVVLFPHFRRGFLALGVADFHVHGRRVVHGGVLVGRILRSISNRKARGGAQRAITRLFVPGISLRHHFRLRSRKQEVQTGEFLGHVTAQLEIIREHDPTDQKRRFQMVGPHLPVDIRDASQRMTFATCMQEKHSTNNIHDDNPWDITTDKIPAHTYKYFPSSLWHKNEENRHIIFSLYPWEI